MCGIVAVASFGVPCTMQELLEVLINGLRRLEYRGYDSAGLCVAEQGKNVVLRKTGNVQALHDMAVKDNAGKLDVSANLANYSGIAHTRWATHGVPCDRNAHPQASSPANEFVVVHNGIVTNYRETKTFLENKGHKFVSDTDTEIVAHLLQFLYEEQTRDGGSVTLAQLGLEVMKLVEGASAFAIVSTHFPGELLVAKRGSPLVIGIRYENDNASASVGDEWNSGASRNCQIFAASDTAPIIEHTKRVVFLEDDDVVSIRDGRVHFFNAQRSESASLLTEVRAVKQVEMELSALTKGNFPHYMLKEIHEQVETVVGSMRGRVNFEDRRISMGGFNNNKRVINTARRIVFISCGTSLNACFAVRPLFEELVPDVPVTVENASDFLDRNPKMFRDDVCVFVSQSGETADTLRAMEHCRKFGTVCVGFTNTVGSAISRQTDFGAHLNCGPEIGVASTKAFTSQIVTLTLLALMLCDDSISLAKRRAEIIDGLNALSGSIAKCISMTESRMRELSARVAESKSVLVLGRGFQYATSLEAALKIKELTYVHTEGLNAGELKHGPLALIDEHITVIIICTKDGITDRVRAAVQQIRARNGRPIVLLSEDDPEVEDLADVVIRVPPTVDCLQTVVNIVPLQLLAYHTAVHRGNNVDCPRNLAKSVTVQ